MDKQFNTLQNTRLLFDNPQIMFRLIEQMDREGVRYVRETDLNAAVLEAIQYRDKTEQQRLKAGFHPQNLFRCGLIIDIDKAQGERRLVFHESLLNLLRTCNASLHQDLTDSRLRGYLVTLRDLLERLRHTSANIQDPDFLELRDDLMERLSQLIGLLRENVRRMQSVSADLADMSLDASRTPEDFAQYRRTLYEQITTLYNRTIHPTLMFLNPKTKLSDGPNLFTILEAMRRQLDHKDQYDLADQIHRSGMSLNAMHKPIQAVANEIDHFLQKTRRGMLEYNAMEHAFNDLLALKTETETVNMGRKWLKGGSFARETGFALGLKGRSRPKQYAFGQSRSYYNLLFSELNARLIDQGREQAKPNLAQHGESTRDQGIDTRRIEALFQWIDGLELRPTSDLVKELHQRLESDIEGYRFPDLLTVITRLNTPPAHLKLITTNRLKTLPAPPDNDDLDTVFVYRKRRLVASNNNDEVYHDQY